MNEIKEKIEAHLRQCSPHILKRNSAVLLKSALKEIIALELEIKNIKCKEGYFND